MYTSEYMLIPYKYFLEDIIIQYNLEYKLSEGSIYVRTKLIIYELKQATILSYEQLVKPLKIRGYYPFIGTNEIFSTKQEKLSSDFV